MKKRIIVRLICICIVIGVIFFLNLDMNPLKDIKSTDVKEVMIANPGSYYTVSDQEDIDMIMKELYNMKLYRRIGGNTDGFSYLIDIKLLSGETISLSISKNVKISRKTYKPDRNYTDTIEELYNKLSKKYKSYPA